jgi:glutaryl-CoA dehydrogenase
MMALEVQSSDTARIASRTTQDGGSLLSELVSMGKLANVDAALAVARTAWQVLGANGVTLEYPVMRHMNNLESVVTYEGTADIHALAIGRALAGLNAFR